MADDLIGSAALYTGIRQALGHTLEEPTAAWLGWLDANNVKQLKIDDPSPDRNGKYYFTYAMGTTPSETTSYGEAYNGGPTTLAPEYLTFGQPVYVAKDPVSGDWFIAGIRPRASALYGGGQPADINPPGVLITKSGLLDATTPETMRAVVYGAPYTLNTRFYWVDTLFTDDFTAEIPSDPSVAIYVLVEVNPVTGLLIYKFGDPFAATLTQPQAWNTDNGSYTLFPQEDGNCFRAGYIRLVNGMTAITRGLLWSVQEIFVKVDYSNIVTCRGEVVTTSGEVVYNS